MKFKHEVKKDGVHFKLLEKHLDSNIASILKAEFLILCTEDVKNFHIDLEDVEFCDSSGLGSLLICQRHTNHHKGKTYLHNCKENLLKLMKISQLDRVFEIVEKK